MNDNSKRVKAKARVLSKLESLDINIRAAEQSDTYSEYYALILSMRQAAEARPAPKCDPIIKVNEPRAKFNSNGGGQGMARLKHIWPCDSFLAEHKPKYNVAAAYFTRWLTKGQYDSKEFVVFKLPEKQVKLRDFLATMNLLNKRYHCFSHDCLAMAPVERLICMDKYALHTMRLYTAALYPLTVPVYPLLLNSIEYAPVDAHLQPWYDHWYHAFLLYLSRFLCARLKNSIYNPCQYKSFFTYYGLVQLLYPYRTAKAMQIEIINSIKNNFAPGTLLNRMAAFIFQHYKDNRRTHRAFIMTNNGIRHIATYLKGNDEHVCRYTKFLRSRDDTYKTKELVWKRPAMPNSKDLPFDILSRIYFQILTSRLDNKIRSLMLNHCGLQTKASAPPGSKSKTYVQLGYNKKTTSRVSYSSLICKGDGGNYLEEYVREMPLACRLHVRRKMHKGVMHPLLLFCAIMEGVVFGDITIDKDKPSDKDFDLLGGCPRTMGNTTSIMDAVVMRKEKPAVKLYLSEMLPFFKNCWKKSPEQDKNDLLTTATHSPPDLAYVQYHAQ